MNNDPRIVRLVKKECYDHEYPDVDAYGVGTEAACGKCGYIATLEDDFREGRIWVQSYPKRYKKL